MVGSRTVASDRPLVVCVDDEPQVLQSLQRVFRCEPCDLLLTEHPRQVVEWMRDRSVDLVLADQRMPEMDGLSLLRAVRDSSPGTACVLSSGFPEMALMMAEGVLRVEGLISKPWDNNLLKQLVRNLLERRSASLRDARPTNQVWVDCATKCTREVMADILNVCEPVRLNGIAPVLQLRNAGLLADSLTRLLKSLVRASAWLDLQIDIRDDAGYAGAFVEALERTRSPRLRPKLGQSRG
jgi:response regulator RpfG family c-di-GMP phosphodiesterase